ncbi:PREDICTED: uncharacterized protein LOC104819452 [Tarenaya hassleriana]|uniref:uncharacterized protein LOC104819452 n=1 Tax=Tarenaya hassleriana TaxID=28532 RepID=UPI00053CA751|nr:PREDICTED: uncharacterized protein LOC104819452 [Tarenaya hassleriana]
MDESIDHYLSTSPWLDANPVEASPWQYEQQNQTKPQLAGLCGELSNNGQAFHTETTSTLTMNCTPDALGGNVDYTEKGIGNFNSNLLGNLHNGRIKDEHVVTIPRFHSYSYEALHGSKLDASEQFPSIFDGTSLASGSVGCNSIKDFDVSFGETLPPFCDGYLLPDTVGGRDDMDTLVESRFVNVEKLLQVNDFSESITTKDRQIMQGEGLPSLATESTIEEKKTMTTGLPQAVVETAYAPSGGCNVSERPRVRARRGQATDPHSIAERLRREKISERMKSLQELVPNSCKTDKASMLDEIIEYVRFLQLQVKVLSMSRLGAAEAVVPLVTERSKNASVPFPSSLVGHEFSPSSDQSALEKEIVRLMETNVSKAVQYLQSRGLCLMPVPLASAISKAKAHERDNNSAGRAQNNSSSSGSNGSLS